jgi:hypothetical protein
MINSEQYYEMWQKLLNKEISEQAWKEYCFKLLAQILEENKDVMRRLKER